MEKDMTSELLDEKGEICIHDIDDPHGFDSFARINHVLETQKILPLTFDFWRGSSYFFENILIGGKIIQNLVYQKDI